MGRQVSKSRSKKLIVPSGFGPVKAGKFYWIQIGNYGYFGMAVNDAQEGESVVLLKEPAVYEVDADQTNPDETYNEGDKLYFDPVNRVFTTVYNEAFRYVGIVEQAKDANGVIWFELI